MKKLNVILAAAMAAGLMTGCGHEHTIVPATCTEPAHCSGCEEYVEGEPLGHDFMEADCTHPEICSRCGERKGRALGHTWIAADFQTPKHCSTCETSIGDIILPRIFVKGLTCDAVLDEVYPYYTVTQNGGEIPIEGTVCFSEYDCFESNDNLAAEEGYMWEAVTTTYEFTDDNSWYYGWKTAGSFENYYEPEHMDESTEYLDEEALGELIASITPEEAEGLENVINAATFSVNYKGELYDQCLKIGVAEQKPHWAKNQQGVYSVRNYFRVPAGYDGMMITAYDSSIVWPEGCYIYDIVSDDTLIYRLKGE